MEKGKPFKKIEYAVIFIISVLIRFYRYAVSPLIGERCRFYPSCSQYFLDSLEKKGLLKGFAGGVARILKCHPFCEGGYDPVDTRKK